MSEFIGRLQQLGVAVEATKGTVVTPQFWIPTTSNSLAEKAVKQIEDGSMGQIGDADDSIITKVYGEGEFEAQIYDKALGAILCSVMGAKPASAGVSPTTHTYTLADTSNAHQTLTFFTQDPNSGVAFSGALVDSFEIVVEPEAIVTCTVGMRSMHAGEWSRQTPDYTSLGNKFLHQHCRVKVADTIANLAAATVLDLRRFSLKIEKAVADWDDMGTLSPTDIVNRQMTVSGEIEVSNTDNTWKNYFMQDTARTMQFQLTRNANSILTMQFPKVEFQSWEPNNDLNEMATQTLEWKAMYDAANALKIISTCTLVNGTIGVNPPQTT